MVQDLTVGIAGLGAIGLTLARALDMGVPGLQLAAVSALDLAKASANVEGFVSPPRVVTNAELATCDIVVIIIFMTHSWSFHWISPFANCYPPALCTARRPLDAVATYIGGSGPRIGVRGNRHRRDRIRSDIHTVLRGRSPATDVSGGKGSGHRR